MTGVQTCALPIYRNLESVEARATIEIVGQDGQAASDDLEASGHRNARASITDGALTSVVETDVTDTRRRGAGTADDGRTSQRARGHEKSEN